MSFGGRLPFVRSVVHRLMLDSTSDFAKVLLVDDATNLDLPLVVWTNEQTKGRGRGANRWWSDAGSLTFTVAIDPAAHGLTLDLEPRLSLALGCTLLSRLSSNFWLSRGNRMGIRWPNDIEIGAKKLAGILLERIQTPRGPRMLIGIGINVNCDLDAAPEEVRAMATTIEREMEDAIESLPSHEDVLAQALVAVQEAIDQLLYAPADLFRDYNALDALRDQWVRVDQGDRIIEGAGAGIDAQGRLLLLTDDGQQAIVGGRVLRD